MVEIAETKDPVLKKREEMIPILNDAIQKWMIIHFIFSPNEDRIERTGNALIVFTSEGYPGTSKLANEQTLYLLVYDKGSQWSFFDYASLAWYVILDPKFGTFEYGVRALQCMHQGSESAIQM